jgi:hypothetical protein
LLEILDQFVIDLEDVGAVEQSVVGFVEALGGPRGIGP